MKVNLTHDRGAILEAARCLADGQGWLALEVLATALDHVPGLAGDPELAELRRALATPINPADERRRWRAGAG